MNKKLIAAAIAAAFVAPSAFGAATLYGKMHTSIDAIDTEDLPVDQDNWEVNSRASRLGVKGSEDLSDGLKAIYQIEFTVDSDGGPDGQGVGTAFGSYRNTFVGLSGDWGTALVGRHDTPGKVAFYAGGIEQLGDSAIDVNSGSTLTRSANLSTSNPAGVFHEYRANDAIAYISPSFSGFTFAGAIIPGEDKDIPDARDGIADHYSVGGWYKGGMFRVGAGYTEYDGGSVDQEVIQITGSVTFGAIKVSAGYENTDNDAFIDGADYDAWGVTGKWTFGNNAISAIYTDGERELSGGTKTIDKDGWGLAAEHNFSKRTKAYLAYATAEDDASDQESDVFSLGMIHNF